MRRAEKMRREEFMRWRVSETQRHKPVNSRNKESVYKQIARENYHTDKGKGKVEIKIDEPVTDDKNEYLKAEKEIKKLNRKSVILRNIAFTAAGLVLSLILNIFSFSVPYAPSVVHIDFSAFTELWIGLAVHPLAGILVVLLKNVLYYFIRPGGLASIPGKVILDSLLIVLAWLISKRLISSPLIQKKTIRREMMDLPPKDYAARAVFTGGFISGIITSFVSLLTTKYIQLPLLYKYFNDQGYSAEAVLQNYQQALQTLHNRFPFTERIFPAIDSIMQGALVYNVPICIIKYTVSALLVAVLYSLTYKTIHKKESSD